MKRKLGIALLIIATVLAGTPEAVRQFHDLNKAVRHWAGTNLGGSFLVYAEDGVDRARPDRYDYHQVASPARPASYGLTASLSLPSEHEHPCPFQQQQRAIERTNNTARTKREAAHAVEQLAHAKQSARATQREQLARQIERTVKLTVKAFGGE